ncbi:hypothetical protein HYH03_010634 [Edaphochlamys debaryana]|uniref:Uncharacterized protein n=1 Tax=Edaphochlamys debaryana TaxID=47281 RepID=A0A835XWL2_9CHLO|nr:hypothetical protein HYH03_010634 [Edaphochlamys debaryana]|eukprot:KAG2490957.1 hypothetical protein HYH03_010634 [Edaphochlamys debaryana]
MKARGAKFESLDFRVDEWNHGISELQTLAVLEALAPCANLSRLELHGEFLLSKDICEAALALRPASLTFNSKASPNLRGAPRDAHVFWTAEMLRGLLPGLKQLWVQSLTHMPAVVLQALGHGSPALEAVIITLGDERKGCTFEDVASVLDVVSTLPQLKDLSLKGGPSSEWPVPSSVLDLARLSSLTRLTSLHLGLWSHGAELASEGHGLNPELRAQFREAEERERAGLMAGVQSMPLFENLTLQFLDLAHVSPRVLGSLVASPSLLRVSSDRDCQDPFCIRLSPLEYSVAAEEGDFLDPAATYARVRPSAAAALAAAASFLSSNDVTDLEVQAPAVGGGMLLPAAAEPGAVAGVAGSALGGHAGWLAALGGAPLSCLTLTCVALDAMDLMALVQHCPGLEGLELKDCAVSPAALPCLLGLPKLRWLGVRLSPSDAQDVVLASLTQLALSPSALETLDVFYAAAEGPWEAWGAWLDGVVAWMQAEATARGLVRSICRGAAG